MSDAYVTNAHLEAVWELLVGDEDGLEDARKAFESTPGDFSARFTAAVRARVAPGARPEVVIDIPEEPEALRRAELEALVRPAAVGFLRSSPSRAELLDQVARIERRRQRRPDWIPTIDRDGRPLSTLAAEPTGQVKAPDRTAVASALRELGDVTLVLPGAGDEDLPRLDMAADGIGEWESALHTLLGLTAPRTAGAVIDLDAGANMALVPEQSRWWPSELAEAMPASEDPGVASELLATSATLGGRQVADDAHSLEVLEAVTRALVGAGDWRYSARWLLESWGPGEDGATIASARAAIAGWADEERSGVLVYVYGGSVHEEEGQSGFPIPLHSYLLAVTRTERGTDAVEEVHRINLSCPGEHWCHRGGCTTVGFPEADGRLRSIVSVGEAMGAVFADTGDAAAAYQALYGECGAPEYAGRVLEQVTALLHRAGWVELSTSEWEGGLEEALLRREGRCVTVIYDPVTRQIRLGDGAPELESMLQLLGDDGVLAGDGEEEAVDFGAAAAERWGADLLTAAQDLLRGRIKQVPESDARLPVQATVLGLHPHADGTLRAPESFTLADRQLSALLRSVGMIPSGE